MLRNSRRFLNLSKRKLILEASLCEHWSKLYDADGEVIGTHKDFMKLNATCMNLRLVNSELYKKRNVFKKAMKKMVHSNIYEGQKV